MPPKGSKKAAVEEPKKRKAVDSKQTTPKKAKPAVVYSSLTQGAGPVSPISVRFEGSNLLSKASKEGAFCHTVKLQAPSSFSLLTTVVPESGEFEGKQIIVLQPAKTFPFMKLAPELRNRIYQFYLAPKDGGVDDSIAVDGKRSGTKALYAKAYADSCKNRVALLAVSKEINTEITRFLYERQLRFENTSTLLDFLVQLETHTRARLTDVYIKTYSKSPNSRTALHLLADATQLETLHIDGGVFAEGDTGKAAKYFWGDASKLLIALNNAKGGAVKAVDVLSFGKNAFTFKDGTKTVRCWSDTLVEDFRDNLHAKLKSLDVPLVYCQGGFRAYGEPIKVSDSAFVKKVKKILLGIWD